ncbi:LAMI_0C03158g1_1 [Lachancea mirantina]|uniref:LAMI_0C03158g1_1 n=1 Tax=Lachancea mirantina TaxID=1230905 RepID=A0A1G4J1K8_9SACH|nr:LAMI_0C03158g1_1 [Lachancea mirantina]
MSEQDIVERALNLGTTYFKNEDYSKAAKIFTKALKLVQSYSVDDLIKLRSKHGLSRHLGDDPSRITHPRYLKILDNRAATWEKLGDLHKALKDTKKMVKEDPYHLKAYVRYGKILQKLQLDGEADEVYERALKIADGGYRRFGISASERLVEAITLQKNLIRSRKISRESLATVGCEKRPIAPDSKDATKFLCGGLKKKKPEIPLGTDLISMCPTELFVAIFRHLTTKELVNCMLVSKLWRWRLMSVPQVFKDIKLNSVSYRHTANLVEFLKRLSKVASRIQINMLIFAPCLKAEEDRSLKLLLSCSFLNVRNCVLKTKELSLDRISNLLRTNPKLASSIENLTLVAAYSRNLSDAAENELLNLTTNLKTLELIVPRTIQPESLTSLLREKNDLQVVEANIQSLESVKIICDFRHVNPFFPYRKAITNSLPSTKLRKLFICGATCESGMNFQWLANFPNLDEFWFENNKNAFFHDFLQTVIERPIFHNLSKLIFREHRINSQPINLLEFPALHENQGFINNLIHLTTLDIMSTSLGGHGLSKLLFSLTENKIRKLNIGDCPYMHFQRTNDVGFLDLALALQKVPHLEDLSVHQAVALDDFSLKNLKAAAKYVKKLRKLDLSFNMALTGPAIYDFLRGLTESDYILLDKLSLHGCPSVSELTVKAIRSKGLVKELDFSLDKASWKVFGVNSLASFN